MITYTTTNENIIVKVPFALKDQFKAAFKTRWNSTEKSWIIDNTETNVDNLEKFITELSTVKTEEVKVKEVVATKEENFGFETTITKIETAMKILNMKKSEIVVITASEPTAKFNVAKFDNDENFFDGTYISTITSIKKGRFFINNVISKIKSVRVYSDLDDNYKIYMSAKEVKTFMKTVNEINEVYSRVMIEAAQKFLDEQAA